MGDIRQVHKLLKIALGPTTPKTAKLKSEDGEITEDKGKQLEQWVEHYAKIYSEEVQPNKNWRQCFSISFDG